VPDPTRNRGRDRLYPHDDFEAGIRIYTRAEGGRRTPPFNGIRWDLAYADDGPTPPMLYMVWPDFVGPDGRSLPTDRPLPVGPVFPARMYVLMDEMRADVHRGRIAPGVRFFCHEGPQRVAEGVVTRVTGLHAARG
jgi:hypothetical protein